MRGVCCGSHHCIGTLVPVWVCTSGLHCAASTPLHGNSDSIAPSRAREGAHAITSRLDGSGDKKVCRKEKFTISQLPLSLSRARPGARAAGRDDGRGVVG